jgi:KaiC/GvpD/RAD55 family RecA-like ATPase
MNVAGVLDDLVAFEELFGPDSPCPILHEAGNPRLIVVTGGNASGKSLFALAYRSLVAREDDKIERITVDMKMRSQGGFRRAFMFGDEEWESTGQISVKAAHGAFTTCRGRENDHVLCLDEPDVVSHIL